MLDLYSLDLLKNIYVAYTHTKELPADEENETERRQIQQDGEAAHLARRRCGKSSKPPRQNPNILRVLRGSWAVTTSLILASLASTSSARMAASSLTPSSALFSVVQPLLCRITDGPTTVCPIAHSIVAAAELAEWAHLLPDARISQPAIAQKIPNLHPPSWSNSPQKIPPKWKLSRKQNQKRDSKHRIQRGTRTRALTSPWRATTRIASPRPNKSGIQPSWPPSERGRWRQQWGTGGGGSGWGGEMKEGREKGMVASRGFVPKWKKWSDGRVRWIKSHGRLWFLGRPGQLHLENPLGFKCKEMFLLSNLVSIATHHQSHT
jgi:hypothetical protein